MTMTTHTMTAEEFSEQVIGSMIGSLDAWAIYLGDKLGLYDAIAASEGITQGDLAESAGVDVRYTQEWLEHQVTAGVLVADDARLAADQRTYSMPAAQQEVLTDRDSLAFLSPFVRLVVTAGLQLPRHLEAYRTGGGVSWGEFGDDMRTGMAESNRPWFMHELGSNWFPALPELDEMLTRGGRVADIGCGEGWSSIAIALAYSDVHVDGFDIDERSIASARVHAAEAGVSDRVTFHNIDAAVAEGTGSYDVVTAFECIHDLPDPVGVLARMREMVVDNGYVLVMDEAVAPAFGDGADEAERLLYGISLFVCLPDSLSNEPSVGTGTVMRPETLDRYATEAGFDRSEVLPIENDMWRFYRLRS